MRDCEHRTSPLSHSGQKDPQPVSAPRRPRAPVVSVSPPGGWGTVPSTEAGGRVEGRKSSAVLACEA